MTPHAPSVREWLADHTRRPRTPREHAIHRQAVEEPLETLRRHGRAVAEVLREGGHRPWDRRGPDLRREVTATVADTGRYRAGLLAADPTLGVPVLGPALAGAALAEGLGDQALTLAVDYPDGVLPEVWFPLDAQLRAQARYQGLVHSNPPELDTYLPWIRPHLGRHFLAVAGAPHAEATRHLVLLEDLRHGAKPEDLATRRPHVTREAARHGTSVLLIGRDPDDPSRQSTRRALAQELLAHGVRTGGDLTVLVRPRLAGELREALRQIAASGVRLHASGAVLYLDHEDVGVATGKGARTESEIAAMVAAGHLHHLPSLREPTPRHALLGARQPPLRGNPLVRGAGRRPVRTPRG